MTEKEKVWLKTLSDAKKILLKHGLCYFLDTGTLLGAVRDRKFIPWDNDIDIGVVNAINTDEIKSVAIDFHQLGYNVSATQDCIAIHDIRNNVELGIKFYVLESDFWVATLGKVSNSQTYYTLYSYLNNEIVYKKNRGLQYVKVVLWKFLKNIRHLIPQKIKNNLLIKSGYIGYETHIPIYLLQKFVEYDFYNQKFMIPKCFEEYLTCRYGVSWKRPNPHYNYICDDCSLNR